MPAAPVGGVFAVGGVLPVGAVFSAPGEGL